MRPGRSWGKIPANRQNNRKSRRFVLPVAFRTRKRCSFINRLPANSRSGRTGNFLRLNGKIDCGTGNTREFAAATMIIAISTINVKCSIITQIWDAHPGFKRGDRSDGRLPDDRAFRRPMPQGGLCLVGCLDHPPSRKIAPKCDLPHIRSKLPAHTFSCQRLADYQRGSTVQLDASTYEETGK